MALLPYSTSPKVATFTANGTLKQTVYNVRDYGAVGNGTTDDTTSLTNTLAAAVAAGGGTVYLPPGTYKVTSTITLVSNILIRGAGTNNTIITCSSSMTTPIFSIVMTTSVYLHDWGLRDLTMDGASGAATRGLQLDSSASNAILYYNNVVSGVVFQNFYIGYYHGANNAGAAQMINTTTVAHCRFQSN